MYQHIKLRNKQSKLQAINWGSLESCNWLDAENERSMKPNEMACEEMSICDTWDMWLRPVHNFLKSRASIHWK